MAQTAESLNIETAHAPLAVVPSAIEKVPSKQTTAVTAIGRRIRRARTEKPLNIVAVAAGSAFLLGIAVRVWRSHYE